MNPVGPWGVYALIDPRNGQIRYVGRSANPTLRIAGHASPSGRTSAWVRELRAVELRPAGRVLEWFDTQQGAQDGEFKWIEDLRAEGAELLNSNGRHGCGSGVWCEVCGEPCGRVRRCTEHEVST